MKKMFISILKCLSLFVSSFLVLTLIVYGAAYVQTEIGVYNEILLVIIGALLYSGMIIIFQNKICGKINIGKKAYIISTSVLPIVPCVLMNLMVGNQNGLGSSEAELWLLSLFMTAILAVDLIAVISANVIQRLHSKV